MLHIKPATKCQSMCFLHISECASLHVWVFVCVCVCERTFKIYSFLPPVVCLPPLTILCGISIAKPAARAEISKRFKRRSRSLRKFGTARQRGVCVLFDFVDFRFFLCIFFSVLHCWHTFSLTISCYKQIKDVITQFNARTLRVKMVFK